LQKIIHEEVTPFFLEKFSKSNMRQLTQAEEKELDDFRHILLYNIDYAELACADLVRDSLSNNKVEINKNALMLYNQLVADFRTVKHRDPTYEDIKQLRNLVYASIKGNYFDEEEKVEE
jgi:hypothetical protein